MSMSNLILVIDTTVVILGDQRDITSGGPSENLKMLPGAWAVGRYVLAQSSVNSSCQSSLYMIYQFFWQNAK